jgi:hypothetical protein
MPPMDTLNFLLYSGTATVRREESVGRGSGASPMPDVPYQSHASKYGKSQPAVKGAIGCSLRATPSGAKNTGMPDIPAHRLTEHSQSRFILKAS